MSELESNGVKIDTQFLKTMSTELVEKISGTETIKPSFAHSSLNLIIPSSTPKIAVNITIPGNGPSPSGLAKYPSKLLLSRGVFY